MYSVHPPPRRAGKLGRKKEKETRLPREIKKYIPPPRITASGKHLKQDREETVFDSGGQGRGGGREDPVILSACRTCSDPEQIAFDTCTRGGGGGVRNVPTRMEIIPKIDWLRTNHVRTSQSRYFVCSPAAPAEFTKNDGVSKRQNIIQYCSSRTTYRFCTGNDFANITIHHDRVGVEEMYWTTIVIVRVLGPAVGKKHVYRTARAVVPLVYCVYNIVLPTAIKSELIVSDLSSFSKVIKHLEDRVPDEYS